MKRSRLQRKTPLKQGESTLKRTPLKPRSEKTAKKYREERVPFVKRILAERPLCEICGRRPSTDVHEILSRGRSGGVHGSVWLDESNVMALCRPCHTWVTDHPREAEQQGYLKRSNDKSQDLLTEHEREE